MDPPTDRAETIAALLRSERFLQDAVGRSDADLRDLIARMCRLAELEVVMILVESTGSKQGSHRVVWQSSSGGQFEDQWFTVPQPARTGMPDP